MSRLALAGLALSVAILIIVLSVINGFETELRQRVLALIPHITVHAANGLEQASLHPLLVSQERPPELLALAPVVQDTVLLSANGNIQGASLLGIDPANYAAVTDLPKYLLEGEFAHLADSPFGIVLGVTLARKLGLALGDSVLVVLARGNVTPAGILPRQRRFTVIDLIDSSSQLDGQAAFINLATGQKLFRTGTKVHALHAKVTDIFATANGAAYLEAQLSKSAVRVNTWARNFGNLYQAIAVQKLTMFVLLSFLVGVAAFNLVSGLIMIVEQRQHDIAVLRTMGASSATLIEIFLMLGTVLAFSGIVLGLVIGTSLAATLPWLYAWVTLTFDLHLMSQYFISYLPVDIRWDDIVWVTVAALGLSVIAVIAPAIRATKLQPSRVLAHE